MSFLNPLMLLGLTAVAVPVIIHLLNKRKFQRVVWAAMRFLQVSIEQNQRRLQIEDLLLLLLRCALLALLAVALARPALRAAGAGGLFGRPKVTAVLLLDNSYSMSTTDGVESRFDQARRAAEEVLNTLPSGSSAAVLLASDVTRGLIPEPTFDLNLARKTVREARRSDRGSNLMPAIQQAIDILTRKPGARREIYLITDGQRQGWRQMESICQLLEQNHRDLHAQLLFVGTEETQNLGVSDLRLTSGLSPVGRPLSFVAQVINYGTVEARAVRVSLRVNADPPSDEATIDAIKPGESQSVTLIAKLRTADYHTVTVQITPDRVPADDHRTIALRGISELKVLLVSGDSGLTARESETFYLRNALLPVPAAEADSYYLKVTQITPQELGAAQFDKYDAVYLANVADFKYDTRQALEQYVRRGGGLLVFPGTNTQAKFYNENLYSRNQLLPAQFGDPFGQADQQEKYFALDDKALDHPVAGVWQDAGTGRPWAAHFFRAYQLVPGVEKKDETVGPARVILRFADSPQAGPLAGKPAVMERTWGLGRVVQFASTADTDWTDLPVRPGVWVPLVQRTLGLIVQRQDEMLNVPVGQKFVFHAGGEMLGKDSVILSPTAGLSAAGDKDLLRDLRRVEMFQGAPSLTFENTDLSGAYEASLAGDPPLTIKFAAQPDSSESNLALLNETQMKSLGEVAGVVHWPAATPLEQLLEQQRVGTELWTWLAVPALLLALTEMFLAHWFSRPK